MGRRNNVVHENEQKKRGLRGNAGACEKKIVPGYVTEAGRKGKSQKPAAEGKEKEGW